LAHNNLRWDTITSSSRKHLDAAVGGTYLDLSAAKAKEHVEKMVSNHGWSEAHTRGMHTVKETDMQAAKLDLLLKRMDDREISTKSRYVQALDWHQRCRFEWVNPLTRYPNYKE
jgi:NADH pyrophosphatase NudC (nudix superfamily)